MKQTCSLELNMFLINDKNKPLTRLELTVPEFLYMPFFIVFVFLSIFGVFVFIHFIVSKSIFYWNMYHHHISLSNYSYVNDEYGTNLVQQYDEL